MLAPDSPILETDSMAGRERARARGKCASMEEGSSSVVLNASLSSFAKGFGGRHFASRILSFRMKMNSFLKRFS